MKALTLIALALAPVQHYELRQLEHGKWWIVEEQLTLTDCVAQSLGAGIESPSLKFKCVKGN